MNSESFFSIISVPLPLTTAPQNQSAADNVLYTIYLYICIIYIIYDKKNLQQAPKSRWLQLLPTFHLQLFSSFSFSDLFH